MPPGWRRLDPVSGRKGSYWEIYISKVLLREGKPEIKRENGNKRSWNEGGRKKKKKKKKTVKRRELKFMGREKVLGNGFRMSLLIVCQEEDLRENSRDSRERERANEWRVSLPQDQKSQFRASIRECK
ncbi:hypothetical protein CEXT_27131 [Caerostris extrusa]|uniref:Uncharacterized protein n=1 Tax=Caerostris extrusa TaxID=172846 RepID=A0AAV4N492_CAEEX|nr:hypothetical protein CEXT_27131 [Caerostris extrusa]